MGDVRHKSIVGGVKLQKSVRCQLYCRRRRMATRAEVIKLSCDEVCEFLSRRLSEEVESDSIESFRENRVNGKALLELTEDDVRELVSPLGERKAIMRLLRSYKEDITPVREIIYSRRSLIV